MSKEEFVRRFTWIDPVINYAKVTYHPDVHEHREHYAVRGACHKIFDYIQPVHSTYLEHVDGYNWDLYRSSHRGIIDGVEYLWGGFVEGLGFFHVMVPLELARPLTNEEREAWSKVTLSMCGSHTGKHSYSFHSGVKAP